MSRIFSSLAILFTAIAFCATSALAFDVSVKANVDNAQVFVGDIFNYEIQVVAPENAIVDLPSFVGNLGSFEQIHLACNAQHLRERRLSDCPAASERRRR